jgi:hypothetical protein
MRLLSASLATAAIVMTAFAATSPANADPFHLIRWSGSGICQIWDQGIPTTPFPSDYAVVSHPVPTFLDALAVKEHLLRTGTCKF